MSIHAVSDSPAKEVLSNPSTPFSSTFKGVLQEIEASLRALVADGTDGAIDLRGVPLEPLEYHQLDEWLGTGEMHSTITALGITRVRETRFAGVWWVSHRNLDNEIVSELIEITPCPALLITAPDDLRVGLQRLQHQLCNDRWLTSDPTTPDRHPPDPHTFIPQS